MQRRDTEISGITERVLGERGCMGGQKTGKRKAGCELAAYQRFNKYEK